MMKEQLSLTLTTEELKDLIANGISPEMQVRLLEALQIREELLQIQELLNEAEALEWAEQECQTKVEAVLHDLRAMADRVVANHLLLHEHSRMIAMAEFMRH